MSHRSKRLFEKLPDFFDVGELTQEQRHQRDLASYAHEQDLYKHMATLSTGAVVILATFLEKLKGAPHWRPLIGVSLGAFGVSIIAVVTMQLLSVRAVSQHPDSFPDSRVQLALFLLLIASGFGGFLVGISALILFGIKNL